MTGRGPYATIVRRWAARVGLLVVLVLLCMPGFWIVLTSVRPNVEVLSKPAVWIPQNPSFDNFRAIFGLLPQQQQGLPVLLYFRNSLVVASTSTVLALLVGSMGGYAFARYRFKHKAGIFLALMLSRSVPGVALSLPVFVIWSRLGLIDSNLGLMIVYVALNIPFTVWLTDGFFSQIPRELSEAAQVEGCTRWQAFWRVELPLSRGGLTAAAIFAFLTSWNEYALASQLTSSSSSKTMPVGLVDFTSQFTVDWAGMCAMGVLIIVPALLLTSVVQRYLIAGLTAGGVKG